MMCSHQVVGASMLKLSSVKSELKLYNLFHTIAAINGICLVVIGLEVLLAYSETGVELKGISEQPTFVRDVRARRGSPHSWTARALLHETSNWSPSPHAQSSGVVLAHHGQNMPKLWSTSIRAGRSEAPTWTQ
jgi:hypothetical protein